MEKPELTNGRKIFDRMRHNRRLLQPEKSCLARILAGEIEDPSIQTSQIIMQEFESVASIKPNGNNLLGWMEISPIYYN